MIGDVVHVLTCPVCRARLTTQERSLRCLDGHVFDVARQGYVNLLTAPSPGTGDTAEMVAARGRFLGAGHYRPIAEVINARVWAATAPRVIVDVGSGPGWYLARLLEPDAAGAASVGLALDLSVYAARRAARVHPRVGAAVCDTWRALPVQDGVADVVLDVFAPRKPPELARVLRPEGLLVVVTPTGGHLQEIRTPLGLLAVEKGKEQRLAHSLTGAFELDTEQRLEIPMTLTRRDVRTLVGMGPSAWHDRGPARAAGLAALQEPVGVTAAVRVATYRRRG